MEYANTSFATLFQELRALRNRHAHGIERGQLQQTVRGCLSAHGICADDAQVLETVKLIQSDAPESFALPTVLIAAITQLLQGRSAEVVVDPWAGIGQLAAVAKNATGATRAEALVAEQKAADLGRLFNPSLVQIVGEPLLRIRAIQDPIDVIASILPAGLPANDQSPLFGMDSQPVILRGDYAERLMIESCGKLRKGGIALFVVENAFFYRSRSAFRDLYKFGIWVHAAFALPARTFIHSHTTIPFSLIVLGRNRPGKLFVAQLTDDDESNQQAVRNFRKGKVGGELQFGRYVDHDSFEGIEKVYFEERVKKFERKIGRASVPLSHLTKRIVRGRRGHSFEALQNELFVPVVGNRQLAVVKLTDLDVHQDQCIQLELDSEKVSSEYLARFLNSDLGFELRSMANFGGNVLQTNFMDMFPVFLPADEGSILRCQEKIENHRILLASLQNQLKEIEFDLWASLKVETDIVSRLYQVSSRIDSGDNDVALQHWIDTLPFPMASILRLWQSSPSNRHKDRYECLLQFFEATTEFVGIILLSAFGRDSEAFEELRTKIEATLYKQKLSLSRSSIGAWRVVVEILGAEIRDGLNGTVVKQLGELFSDSSNDLPRALSNTALVQIFAEANRMRNDWTGHGGAVTATLAEQRHRQALELLERLRFHLSSIWKHVRLIQPIGGRDMETHYENEVRLLVGSNNQFLTDNIITGGSLASTRLYLICGEGPQTLKLEPLVRMAASPVSEMNACYFFNRYEGSNARFVTYHFSQIAEVNDSVGGLSASVASFFVSGKAT